MENRRMRFGAWVTLGVVAMGLALPALAQRKPPYYVSIRASKALMRTGPGRNYPGNWLYQRRALPMKVVDIYGEWRKVEDPDGTQGWMLRVLLDEARTAMVRGSVVEMRSTPSPDGHVNWRAAPGVVGRISKCNNGWCWFDVEGRGGGYVEQSRVWGVDPGEVVD
jgi:SH3-like domain-containing protein